MQIFDLMTQQGHATGAPIVAVVAIFKNEGAAQAQLAVIVAGQRIEAADHGFIKKLQALVETGVLRRLNADFARLQGIEPEPDTGRRNNKKNGFVDRHGVEV